MTTVRRLLATGLAAAAIGGGAGSTALVAHAAPRPTPAQHKPHRVRPCTSPTPGPGMPARTCTTKPKTKPKGTHTVKGTHTLKHRTTRTKGQHMPAASASPTPQARTPVTPTSTSPAG